VPGRVQAQVRVQVRVPSLEEVAVAVAVAAEAVVQEWALGSALAVVLGAHLALELAGCCSSS